MFVSIVLNCYCIMTYNKKTNFKTLESCKSLVYKDLWISKPSVAFFHNTHAFENKLYRAFFLMKKKEVHSQKTLFSPKNMFFLLYCNALFCYLIELKNFLFFLQRSTLLAYSNALYFKPFTAFFTSVKLIK